MHISFSHCCLFLLGTLATVALAFAENSNELGDGVVLGEAQAEKRGWRDLGHAFGKRAGWHDLQTSWGKRDDGDKRGWHDLNTAFGKRGWRDLRMAFGKRYADGSDVREDMFEDDKRGWRDLSNSFGKRDWRSLQTAFGKRSQDNEIMEDLITKQLFEDIDADGKNTFRIKISINETLYTFAQ